MPAAAWAAQFLAQHKTGFQMAKGFPEHTSQEALASGCVMAACLTALGPSHPHSSSASGGHAAVCFVISTHLPHIMRKLGCTSPCDL